jgi:hypothetical protein
VSSMLSVEVASANELARRSDRSAAIVAQHRAALRRIHKPRRATTRRDRQLQLAVEC